MTRKFTFLLMVLLALTGLQGWAQQRGYTYEKLTGTPDPNAEYVLGYQDDAGNYYFHSSGEAANSLTLTSPEVAEPKLYTIEDYSNNVYVASYSTNKYLRVQTNQVSIGAMSTLPWDPSPYLLFSNGHIESAISNGYIIYHDGSIIKASTTASAYLYFYKRTGSSAPTYTVTVTSDTDGCTASADKDEYEAGENVTLSYTADAFHTFGAWVEDYDDVTITNNQFTMPEHDVTISATFIEKTKYAISITPSTEANIYAKYQGQDINQAPEGLVIDLSYANLQTGYVFDHWAVTCGTSPVQVTNNQFTMPAGNVTVSAVFSELIAHTVTISQPETGGTISVTEGGMAISSGDAVYPGATLTFSNTPTMNPYYNALFKLDHYVVIPDGQSPVFVYTNTYTMPNCNLTVAAVFAPLYFPTISSNYPNNVTLWAGPNNMNLHQTGGPYNPGVAAGEYVFIVAEDVDGYRKTITWSDSQGTHDPISYPGDSRPCFVMPADNNVTVSVQYAVIQKYNVTLNYNTAGGSIVVSPNQQVEGGTWVNITIYGANTHFTFNESALSVTCNTTPTQTVAITTVNPGYSYKFQMPEDNVTVNAEFTEDENYSVNIIKPEGCNFDVSYEYQGQNATTGNVYVGYKVYLENLVTSSGYHFDGWNVTFDDHGTDRPVAITEQYGRTYFLMPQGPVTLTANVTELAGRTVTIVQTTGGTITVNGNNSGTFQAFQGEAINMSYSLASGYVFDRWIITTATQPYYTTGTWFSMLDEDLSIQAQFLKESTVNDGSSTNSNIPFTQNGWQWDGSDWNYVMTRSQFIIPATDLENVYDASITDMTFYTNNNALSFDAEWKVYVKEVEYTQFGETYSYENVDNMTQVYNGTMTIENNKMKVHFDTPYQYNDGNLMISFVQQTTNTEEPWAYWYGVNSTNYSDRLSFGGYGSINNYSNFLPKIMFSYKPSENPTTRYEITVNEVEGTTLGASRRLAAEGAVITLTQETSNDYTFESWNVTAGGNPVSVDENNQFTMPAANVTVSANVTMKPHFTITLDPEMANGELTLSPESGIGYLQGATVRISNNPAVGYKFNEEYGIKYWIAGEENPEVITLPVPEWGSYSIEMPANNIVISARFIALTGYTITYHVNGVVTEETVYENERIYPSTPTAPAGTSFVGWATSDIATYNETAPTLFQTGNFPTENLDLYAVFHYADQSKWAPVYDESSLSTDGSDRVIFAYYYSGNPTIMTYYDSWHFESAIGEMNSNAEIVSIPANTTIFKPVKANVTWKFYFDYNGSETTLADYGGNNLYPLSYYSDGSETDTWNIYLGFVYDNNDYIGLRNNNTFNIHDSNQARLYKEVMPEGGLDAYFTEVLSVSGNESLNEEKEVRNLLINRGASYTVNSAKLTVLGFTKNVENLAANLVVTNGGQLVHYTEGVNATFKKTINAYTGDYDNYYFIANPTDEEYVEGLGWDGIDLYTFDPATDGEGNEWINEAYVNNNTNIERGTGYLYANQTGTTLSFAGELVPANSTEYSEMSLVLAGTGEGRDFPGFNLLGNPYACNVYLEKPAYLLDGGEYLSIAANTAIAPCEGFFVEAESNGENLSISTTNLGSRSNSICLTVSQNRGNVIDRAIVSFDGSSNLHKFMMNPAHTNLSLAKGGETFAAVSTEAEGEMPVNFKAEKDGTYTITVNTENVEANYLHLIDNMTGMDTDLLSTPSYTFNATTSDYASRFKLVFNMKNDNAEANLNSFAYISNGEIIISNEGRATLQVIDMMGRIVRNQQIEGEARISTEGMVAGVYVLSLNGNVQKIVVR